MTTFLEKCMGHIDNLLQCQNSAPEFLLSLNKIHRVLQNACAAVEFYGENSIYNTIHSQLELRLDELSNTEDENDRNAILEELEDFDIHLLEILASSLPWNESLRKGFTLTQERDLLFHQKFPLYLEYHNYFHRCLQTAPNPTPPTKVKDNRWNNLYERLETDENAELDRQTLARYIQTCMKILTSKDGLGIFIQAIYFREAATCIWNIKNWCQKQLKPDSPDIYQTVQIVYEYAQQLDVRLFIKVENCSPDIADILETTQNSSLLKREDFEELPDSEFRKCHLKRPDGYLFLYRKTGEPEKHLKRIGIRVENQNIAPLRTNTLLECQMYLCFTQIEGVVEFTVTLTNKSQSFPITFESLDDLGDFQYHLTSIKPSPTCNYLQIRFEVPVLRKRFLKPPKATIYEFGEPGILQLWEREVFNHEAPAAPLVVLLNKEMEDRFVMHCIELTKESKIKKKDTVCKCKPQQCLHTNITDVTRPVLSLCHRGYQRASENQKYESLTIIFPEVQSKNKFEKELEGVIADYQRRRRHQEQMIYREVGGLS